MRARLEAQKHRSIGHGPEEFEDGRAAIDFNFYMLASNASEALKGLKETDPLALRNTVTSILECLRRNRSTGGF
jgi:hypothetical protein